MPPSTHPIDSICQSLERPKSMAVRERLTKLFEFLKAYTDLRITPELSPASPSPAPEQAELVERVIRHSQNLRAAWHPEGNGDTESTENS